MKHLKTTFINQLKKTENLILLAIIGFDFYIRLWDAAHLFKWIYDYDEGAYSLGGRFISQGYMPYKDFTLVHPPLYDLSLALIYKIFGYDFIYGRYFSIFLSVVCVILAYLIIKKLYNSTAGLIAAAFMVVFPGFSLFWYRVVQEPLGILFFLLAIYFATDYILRRQISDRLIISGACLGLAMATKYTFIPAIAGCFLGLAVIALRGQWRQLSGWSNREIWLLAAGAVAGFMLVTGFFLAKYPHEFISQTLSSQIGFRVGNIPLENYAGVLNPFQINWTKPITNLCIYLVILVFIALLIRRRFTNANLFLFVGLWISLTLSFFFNSFGQIRYFVSPFIFALFSIESFIPALDFKSISRQLTFKTLRYNSGFITALALLLLCTAGILTLLKNDYNYMGPSGITYEEQANRETVAYLESLGARKVYSLDPIIPALSPQINSTLDFDTFGMLAVLKNTPDDILKLETDSGIDYIIINSVPRLLGLSTGEFGDLALKVSQNARLVKTIVPGELPIFQVEVYALYGPTDTNSDSSTETTSLINDPIYP